MYHISYRINQGTLRFPALGQTYSLDSLHMSYQNIFAIGHSYVFDDIIVYSFISDGVSHQCLWPHCCRPDILVAHNTSTHESDLLFGLHCQLSTVSQMVTSQERFTLHASLNCFFTHSSSSSFPFILPAHTAPTVSVFSLGFSFVAYTVQQSWKCQSSSQPTRRAGLE